MKTKLMKQSIYVSYLFVTWALLLPPTLAWGTEATQVQQIGALSGTVFEAVASAVHVVPFSPAIDARTTPILLGPGQLAVTPGSAGQVSGLSEAERSAIRQAYDAGQTILLLHGSVHDIEALHVLLNDGVTHHSTSDPVVLAYALRQERHIPTVRVIHNVRPNLRAPGGIGPEHNDEGALPRALDVIISELLHPPVVAAAPLTTARAAAADNSPVDWKQSPVQTATITSTTQGVYNTPISIYALHSCQENKDYYLVDTGGDWTATEAQFMSASANAGQIALSSDGSNVETSFEPDYRYCFAALEPILGSDQRVCR